MIELQEHRETKRFRILKPPTLNYLSLKSLEEEIKRSYQKVAQQNSRNSKQSCPSKSTHHHRTCSPTRIWPLLHPALH